MSISGPGKLNMPVRVCGAQLFQIVRHFPRQVDLLRLHLDAQAELRLVEIHQIVEQVPHRYAAANKVLRRHLRLITGIERAQIRGLSHDRVVRCPHVMPEHSQEKVAGLLHLSMEMADRFRDGLIDRLVEPGDFLHSRIIARVGLLPETENAGAQGAVFGDELIDIEAALGAQHCPGLRCRLRGSPAVGARPLDFCTCSSAVWGVAMSLAAASRIDSA